MWYREEEKNNKDIKISWPRDTVVLVGHTRQTEVNLKNIENDPRKAVIYVDCGKSELQGFSLTEGRNVQLESKNIGAQEKQEDRYN